MESNTRLKFLMITLLGFLVVILMLNGNIQKVVNFPSILEEIGFTFCILILTVVAGFSTIENEKYGKENN